MFKSGKSRGSKNERLGSKESSILSASLRHLGLRKTDSSVEKASKKKSIMSSSFRNLGSKSKRSSRKHQASTKGTISISLSKIKVVEQESFEKMPEFDDEDYRAGFIESQRNTVTPVAPCTSQRNVRVQVDEENLTRMRDKISVKSHVFVRQLQGDDELLIHELENTSEPVEITIEDDITAKNKSMEKSSKQTNENKTSTAWESGPPANASFESLDLLCTSNLEGSGDSFDI